MKMITRATKINTRNIFFNKSNQILSYADNIDFIARKTTDIRTAFEGLENETKSIGLYVKDQIHAIQQE